MSEEKPNTGQANATEPTESPDKAEEMRQRVRASTHKMVVESQIPVPGFYKQALPKETSVHASRGMIEDPPSSSRSSPPPPLERKQHHNLLRNSKFESWEPRIREYFAKDADYAYMCGLLTNMLQTVCGFCSGCGHLPNTCASKKNVDDVMKQTGNSYAWGRVKNVYKRASYTARRHAKQEYISRSRSAGK